MSIYHTYLKLKLHHLHGCPPTIINASSEMKVLLQEPSSDWWPLKVNNFYNQHLDAIKKIQRSATYDVYHDFKLKLKTE